MDGVTDTCGKVTDRVFPTAGHDWVGGGGGRGASLDQNKGSGEYVPPPPAAERGT